MYKKLSKLAVPYSQVQVDTMRLSLKQSVYCFLLRTKEAGYIWDTNRKELRKDLPVDTLVAVSDNFKPVAFLSSIAVRRYTGEHTCFSNNGGSKCNNNSTVIWCHIVPLDKLVVGEDGNIQFNEANDYGTYNYHA